MKAREPMLQYEGGVGGRKGPRCRTIGVRGGHQGERSATHALQQPVGRGTVRGGNGAWHEQRPTVKWRGVHFHKGRRTAGFWNGRKSENCSRTLEKGGKIPLAPRFRL